MRNWSNLPIEILENVFKLIFGDLDDVGRESLCQCMLTCKNWRFPAQRSLFLKIALYNEEQAKKLLKFLQNNEDFPGRRTRRLYYSLENYNSFLDESKDMIYYQHDTYLNSFIEAFPNLERLETSEPNYAFYVILLTARKFSQLKFLKVIEEPKVNEYIRIYVDCALAYRNSLTRLLLCDSLEDIYTGPNNENETVYQTAQYDRLARKLDTFSQLVRLKVEKHTDNNCLKDNLDYILDSCRDLKSFEFTIHPLEDMTNEPITSTNVIDLSSISARPDITKVDGTSYINNDNILLYFMHKFPNLEELRLADVFSVSIWATGRQIKYTPTVLANFLSYITKIPHHRVEGIHVKRSMIPNILLEHYNTSSLDNNTHQNDLTIEYRQTHNFEGGGGNEKCTKLEVTSADLLEENQHRFVVRYFITDEEQELIPHFDLLKEAGHHIKNLEIDMVEAHQHDVLCKIVKDGEMLDNILRHCTQLQQLTLVLYEHGLNCSLPTMNRPRSESLTNLTVQSAELCDEFCASMAEMVPNLKALKFYECTTGEGNSFSSVLNMPGASIDELYWKDSGNYGRRIIDKLGLTLKVGITTKHYLFEKGSPNAPVDVSEEEFRNLSKKDEFKTVYIHCHSIAKLTLSVDPFLFEIHNP